MEIFWIILFIVAAFVISMIALAARGAEKTRELRQQILAEHTLDELYISTSGRTVLGINFARKELLLGVESAQSIYQFSDIVSVELVENEVTINQTDRGSQLLSAAVGGLAFGALGAAVGGLTGSSRGHTRVSGLMLRLIINDATQPIYTIAFYRSPDPKGSDRSNLIVQDALDEASRIHAHLVNAMRDSQQLNAKSVLLEEQDTDITAKELKEIWDLQQSGVLTEAEFLDKKSKFLKMETSPVALPSSSARDREPHLFNVSLTHQGDNPMGVINQIREIIPQFSMRQAMNIVISPPRLIAWRVSLEQAEQVKSKLVGAGASARVERIN